MLRSVFLCYITFIAWYSNKQKNNNAWNIIIGRRGNGGSTRLYVCACKYWTKERLIYWGLNISERSSSSSIVLFKQRKNKIANVGLVFFLLLLIFNVLHKISWIEEKKLLNAAYRVNKTKQKKIAELNWIQICCSFWHTFNREMLYMCISRFFNTSGKLLVKKEARSTNEFFLLYLSKSLGKSKS
jgi:hypothetical protein